MNILVLNSGSSSIKFAIYQVNGLNLVCHGLVEGIGTKLAKGIVKTPKAVSEMLEDATHREALEWVTGQLSSLGFTANSMLGVGHRVVHGGEKFQDSQIIDSQNITQLQSISNLAPLHNPANLMGIEAMNELYPALKNIAVFDTAFHQTMPPKAFLYPIPYELYSKHKLRRYGFHGTSYEYIHSQIKLWVPIENPSYLIAHLGNGCSASAIENGKCADTTMGLTPLEGLMMGTRSGTVDPGLHHYLVSQLGWSLDEVHDTLNKKSGLLGLSEHSSDMREVSEPEPPTQQCKLALDVYCYRLARELLGLCAGLTKLDALVFTGGVGENSAFIRKQVLENMSILGLKLSTEDNLKTTRGESGNIAQKESKPILVIPTNEEQMIAQKVIEILGN